MRLKLPILENFEFGGPQQWAALMLLALLAFSCYAARSGPILDSEHMVAQPLLNQMSDSILAYRLAQLVELPPRPTEGRILASESSSHLWPRGPFILFGLWLGGALWWVTRRLYNNSGGYVALALYCSSPVIVAASSQVNAEILAAWGFFGIIYTAIGVAHTLYAPPKKWGPRILLLGAAFGLTAAAHLSAAIMGLALAAFFMLYLAPGRRLAAAAILIIAAIIAAITLWAFYGFSASIHQMAIARSLRFAINHAALAPFAIRETLPLLCLALTSLAVFIFWPRTRYFGNWTPLLAFSLLTVIGPALGDARFWAMPFVFVFIGGIFSDVLETRCGRAAIVLITLAITAQTAILLCGIAGRKMANF